MKILNVIEANVIKGQSKKLRLALNEGRWNFRFKNAWKNTWSQSYDYRIYNYNASVPVG
jgi:hypothetical protein